MSYCNSYLLTYAYSQDHWHPKWWFDHANKLPQALSILCILRRPPSCSWLGATWSSASSLGVRDMFSRTCFTKHIEVILRHQSTSLPIMCPAHRNIRNLLFRCPIYFWSSRIVLKTLFSKVFIASIFIRNHDSATKY